MANKVDRASSRVYHWEHLFAGSSYQAYLTHKAARWMIRDIARRYGIPIPHLYTVTRRNDSRMAWASWGSGHSTVNFNLRFKSITAMILVHEMAHLVVGQLHDNEDSSKHGDVWLGTYVNLLNHYSVLPTSASLPSLREYGFEMMHPYYCSPEELWNLD